MRKPWLRFLLGVLSAGIIRAAILSLVTLSAFENIFYKKILRKFDKYYKKNIM